MAQHKAHKEKAGILPCGWPCGPNALPACEAPPKSGTGMNPALQYFEMQCVFPVILHNAQRFPGKGILGIFGVAPPTTGPDIPRDAIPLPTTPPEKPLDTIPLPK